VSVFYDDGPEEDAQPDMVYISAAELHGETWKLTPQIGFSDKQDHCNALREKGFPVVEAEFAWQGTGEGSDSDRKLAIRVPYFVDGSDAIQCATPLLEITVPGPVAYSKDLRSAGVRFDLQIVAPDPVQSASLILSKPSEEHYENIFRQSPASSVSIRVAPSRFPDLAALLEAKESREVWLGEGKPVQSRDPPPVNATEPVRSPIEDVSPFGTPRMLFDEVELIGFRITKPGLNRVDLQELLAPLNQALANAAGPTGVMDFNYQPASATIVIELLRYGRMRCELPRPPLTERDYISQHELIVRVMVGRLDDDTAQARDPASFVPALFVDEPWSKRLGRELEGYPKELVWFTTGDSKVVGSDGRLEGSSTSVPLTQVLHAVPEPIIGKRGDARPFFSVEYPSVSFDDRFEAVDVADLSDISWPGLGRWRQADFVDPEFRRSFARSVMRPGADEFQTIQVCPIDLRRRFASPALIRGRFSFSDLRIQFPEGIAQLNLRVADELKATVSGEAWAKMIQIFGGSKRAPGADDGSFTASCVTGEWYRVKSNSRLTIEESI
jgi:hypothetical protein